MDVNVAARTSTGGAERSTFSVYLGDINRYPLLDRAREYELAVRSRAGDVSAREELIKANLRFVVTVAKRYVGNGVALEDLINEGNLGLVMAASRFDPDRGTKFISYAVWWIRQAILRAVSENSRLVRLPMNRVALAQKAAREARRIEQVTGREADAASIAASLDVTAAEVEEVTVFSRAHLSLDQTVGQDADEVSMVEQIEDVDGLRPDAAAERALAERDLRRMMQHLSNREREIVTSYFGMDGEEPRTLEQIGKQLGYTRERIRQIKEEAIDKLRDADRRLSSYANA
jgi:RNA polymerase primary sigma factor